MGGKNPQGVEINANSRYLTLDGHPWLPVMGEFHYSRYPARDWREALLKMKAGGITIAASYVFWIHHEEIEGQTDWSGDRDLRRFVELCAELGMYAFPRIGPWAHGECRNGGFPDWLLIKCGEEVRKAAQPYLTYVERFFHEIARQLKGLLWKDGGPVIGIQLENELTWDPGHILTLKNLARQAGFDVPLYTMTGWGPAQVPADEVIPLFGGYPDAFWDRQVEDWSRSSRKHYFFSQLRDDHTIGADLRKRQDVLDLSFLERYPFLTCEIGGGIQVSYHRRPYITPNDIAVPPMTKIGSGSNLPGYYMYHGGSNPPGKLSTLQESQATGYWNDLPVISYDFQAAIGEYGQLNQHYHALRLLHLFLLDFGIILAPMTAILPDQTPTGLDDRQTLRWAVRTDGRHGFIFINNYQRIETLPEKSDVQLELRMQEDTLLIPQAPIDIPSGAFMIWPFNLALNGILLQYATAQLVCQLEDDGAPLYVFAERSGIRVEFVFPPELLACVKGVHLEAGRFLRNVEPGTLILLQGRDGAEARILLLNEEQSLQCWKADLWGQERIFLSPASLIFDKNKLTLRTRQKEDLWFSVYPEPVGVLAVDPTFEKPAEIFARYTFSAMEKKVPVTLHQIKPAEPARETPLGSSGVAQAPEDADFASAEIWKVDLLADSLNSASEVTLQIDYRGDTGRAYLNDRLIADDFYHGRVWEIGLRRFAPEILEKGLTLKFLPLRREAPIYIAPEHRPDFGTAEEILEIGAIWAIVEYEQVIETKKGG